MSDSFQPSGQTEQAFGQLWSQHMQQYGQPEGGFKMMEAFFGHSSALLYVLSALWFSALFSG
jgi:hypothetical protein